VGPIVQDDQGFLWVGSQFGLHRFDGYRFKVFGHDPENKANLSGVFVSALFKDRDGTLWVGCEQFLNKLDRETETFTRYPIPFVLHISPLSESSLPFSFYEDRFGLFWIYHVSGNALALFDQRTNTLTQFSFRSQSQPATALTGVTSMLEDHSGTLWLATNGAGLLKFDREHLQFIRYRHNVTDPDSIGEDSIGNLALYKEGIMWVSLGGLGLTSFATSPMPFKRYRHGFGEPFVGAIYQDREGILWIGTHEALNRIDRNANKYTPYHIGEPGEGTDVISICEDRSGHLWVGTFSHGLYQFDRPTGRFKAYKHDSSNPYSLSNDIISRLLIDNNGTLWAATWDGLDRFDATTDHFATYRPDSKDRSFYQELVEDQRGFLWLGTHAAGLQRFDPATGQFKVFSHDVDRPETLSNSRVNSVHFDRLGTMWVDTQDGLDKFDATTGKFKAYTLRSGLAGDVVGCVLEDNRGNLWMSTNEGVAQFDPQRNTFQNYSTADGLPGHDLTGWGACFKSASGEMFFGGFSGATSFFPDKVKGSVYVPQIVLTDFKVFGASAIPGMNSILKKTINYTDSITLSAKQNIFSIGFSALSYFDPTTNRYRYMLTELDRKWNEVGSDQRLASYTTLPAGKYTFRAQGATGRGAWDAPGVELQIEILPLWWETMWFRIALGLAVFLFAWAVYRYRMHQISATISARLDERLAERTRVARELHDTLLQTIQGSKLVVDDALREPSDLDRMRRAMGMLSHWLERAAAEVRTALNSFRTPGSETDDLHGALWLAVDDCRRRTSMEATLSVIGEIKQTHPVVRDEIYRIGLEAITNSTIHSGGARLQVIVRYGQDLTLRVVDDGVGIDPRVADEGKSGHFGLKGMRDCAARIGARLKIANSPLGGTDVMLIVPGRFVFQKVQVTRSQAVRTAFIGKSHASGWIPSEHRERTRGTNSN
jgi:signal transduction histidine kinase/ligand-binding sensor domain-containing protein